MLASNETHTCGCPNGMKLNVDQISCSAQVKKESIYIGMRNYLIAMEQETFGRHQIEKAKVLPIYIHKMTINPINGHVFIADNIAKMIYEYELNNETTNELVKKNVGKVTSMAFGSYSYIGFHDHQSIRSFVSDHLSNNLYWSDSEHGTIEILSLNTNYRATVYHYLGMEKPIAIALVPELGYALFCAKMLNKFCSSKSLFRQRNVCCTKI